MKDTELTPELQAALARLEAPAVGDSFYDNLEALVDVEETPVAPAERRSHYSFRSRIVLPSLTAAAAIVAVVAIIATSSPTSTNRNDVAKPGGSPSSTSVAPTEVPGFQPTLASQVIEKAGSVYAATKGVSGTVTYVNYCANFVEGPDKFASQTCDVARSEETVTDFRFNEDGDAWLSLVRTNGVQEHPVGPYYAYRSKENITQQLTMYDEKGVPSKQPTFFQSDTDDPGYNMAKYIFGHFSLSSLLNGLSVDTNAKLQDVTVDGRPAWSIHSSGLETDAFGFSPDEVTAVFDKSTYFPLSIEEKRQGKPYSKVDVSNLRTTTTFTDADFMLVPAPGQQVRVPQFQGAKWSRVDDVAALAKLTSYQPLAPTTVPSGYKLSSVVFVADAGASGAEGQNDRNRDVVNLTYRRGLQEFEFTTRLAKQGQYPWIDPHSAEGQQNAKETTFTVKGGAYNDTKATLVLGFGVTPHVWVEGATLVTTIIGDLTATELQDVLGSVQRQ